MTKEEIKEVLERHEHWLRKDCDGWCEMRADMSWANLCEADLCEANLRGANLRGADLRGAKNVPFIPFARPDFGAFVEAEMEENDG